MADLIRQCCVCNKTDQPNDQGNPTSHGYHSKFCFLKQHGADEGMLNVSEKHNFKYSYCTQMEE